MRGGRWWRRTSPPGTRLHRLRAILPCINRILGHGLVGSRSGTNNTGELTTIGEACIWLWDHIEERAEDGKPLRAVIHYDSEYARDLVLQCGYSNTKK